MSEEPPSGLARGGVLTPSSSTADAEALLLSQLPLIKAVVGFIARRHRLGRAEEEDLKSVVHLKLVEKDYEVLRKFQGKSTLKTYLTTVIQRVFLDDRIARWGKWRPSAEAKRLGPLAVRLEELLSRDDFTFDEAFQTLHASYGIAESREEIRSLAERLPPRTRRLFVGEEALHTLATDESEAERDLAAREEHHFAMRAGSSLRRAMQLLSAEDRLILKMRFEDSFTVAEIAHVLRLEAKPLYRRIDASLARLRTSMETDGVKAEEVVDLLARGSSELGGSAEGGGFTGNPRPRPSKEAGA